MYFLVVLLTALGGYITFQSLRHGKKADRDFGIILLIAAAGTGMITFFALSVLSA